MLKRNAWLTVAIVASLCGMGVYLESQEAKPAAAAKADAAGFVSLFDGETLNGWDGSPDNWSVKDGCIVGQSTADKPLKGNTFLISGTPVAFAAQAAQTWTPPLILQYLLGRIDLSAEERAAADVNHDGRIDIADLIAFYSSLNTGGSGLPPRR